MFFRVKGTAGRQYLQIAESVREGTRVRQRVIATVGWLEVLQASGQLDRLLCSGLRFSEKIRVLDAHAAGETEPVSVRKIGPDLVCGHHVYPDAARACLPVRCDGLAIAHGAGLGGEQHNDAALTEKAVAAAVALQIRGSLPEGICHVLGTVSRHQARDGTLQYLAATSKPSPETAFPFRRRIILLFRDRPAQASTPRSEASRALGSRAK